VTERDFQRRVMHLAAVTGWTAFHFNDSRRQVRPGVFVGDRDSAGFPDLILVHPLHGVAFAELKAERGRVSDKQREVILKLAAAGAQVFLWRPQHWPQIEHFFKTGEAAPAGGGPLREAGSRPAASPNTPTAEVSA
jgi:hypothetical protein